MLPTADAEFVHIVDTALQDAVRRGGHWLACRPGCSQCCTGVFRISQLDAERLRHGLQVLTEENPLAAAQLLQRVHDSRKMLTPGFPGDVESGQLHEDDASLEAFETFADDVTCPVLDPVRGTCTLYRYRPMTCRTFGPPVMTVEGGLATCELCFQGASAQEVEQAQLFLPDSEVENCVAAELSRSGATIVTFAFDLDQLL